MIVEMLKDVSISRLGLSASLFRSLAMIVWHPITILHLTKLVRCRISDFPLSLLSARSVLTHHLWSFGPHHSVVWQRPIRLASICFRWTSMKPSMLLSLRWSDHWPLAPVTLCMPSTAITYPSHEHVLLLTTTSRVRGSTCSATTRISLISSSIRKYDRVRSGNCSIP